MQIDDFLRLLHVESGPDARGNYKCRCPAHDDHTASMSVGLGKNRKGQDIILLKCHRGCASSDIVRAMGLSMKDLTCEDRPPWEENTSSVGCADTFPSRGRQSTSSGAPRYLPPKGKAMQPAGKAKAQAIADLPKEKADHGEKKIECTYQYLDEEGKLLYEAVRYRYADGKKTFRQRRPDPEKPGQYIFNMENVRLVLYRLPEVIKAIREKKSIWIAEGEKDADNLAKIGLCGTSSPMGNGYLNFMGNEFGHPEWIDFPREGNGWSHHYARRQWSLVQNGFLKYEWLANFDRDMVHLAEDYQVLNKSKPESLWLDQEKKLIIFERGQLIFVFNFHPTWSQEDAFVSIRRTGRGKYRTILSSDDEAFGGQNRISKEQVYTAGEEKEGLGFRVYIPCRTAMVLKKIKGKA